MAMKVMFYLEQEHVDKADAIARALSLEYGVEVSRSAALRKLIEQFSLPMRTIDSPKIYPVDRESQPA